MILNININDSNHMDMSQICTGDGHYFRPSKPHSGKLCVVMGLLMIVRDPGARISKTPDKNGKKGRSAPDGL